MSSVVFILGAGASRKAGAPLMSDFLEIADLLHRGGKINESAEHFERVFDARGKLQSVHSKSSLDISNIEQVFNALEFSRVIGKFPDSPEDFVEEAIASLREVIAVTLEKTIRFPVHDGRRITPPAPYQQFAELLKYITTDAKPNQTASVITFNYDLAVDFALHFNNMGPNYAFDGDTNLGVPLLKLHGSTNWGKCSKCGRVVCWDLKEYFSKFSFRFLSDFDYVNLDLSAKLAHHSHCDEPLSPEPFLVPPTWNKADHHSAISGIWKRAAAELAEAEYIFICGYSMPQTDAFFHLLYSLGTVGPKMLKRIIVFNPDSSGLVEERFRKLVGPGAESAFGYSTESFESAVGLIRNIFVSLTASVER